MSLEQKVRQEVDTWKILIEGPNRQIVNYEDLIKPVFYGIGITVTEKGLKLYLDNITINKITKKYTSFKFSEAAEEFRKDLVAYQYLKHGSAKKAAEIMNVGNEKGSGRIILSQVLNRNKLRFNDIKNNPDKYTTFKKDSQFKISDEEIIDTLDKEVKRYSNIPVPILFKRLINNNSRDIATRFMLLAKEIVQEEYVQTNKLVMNEYENLSFNEAVELFKTNYLKDLFIESGMNGRLAAEKAGINYGSYKEHMSRRKISMRKLKQQK